jgi:hypothetical protein
MSAPNLPPVGTATTSDDCTPLKETTVSALTTDSSCVDLLVGSGGEEDTQLLPLTSIFHCPSSKRVPTPRMEKCPGHASGVVIRSPQGINHVRFGMC